MLGESPCIFAGHETFNVKNERAANGSELLYTRLIYVILYYVNVIFRGVYCSRPQK